MIMVHGVQPVNQCGRKRDADGEFPWASIVGFISDRFCELVEELD